MATLAAFISLAVVPVSAGDFIRVEQDETRARLQTSITRYTKDGTTVDLLGAIHIADRSYYEALNQRFAGYDSLLFEMIGGENLGAAAVPPAAPPADVADVNKPRKLDGLRQIYASACGFLELTGQVDVVDYQAKNFIHADLTADEFEALQAQRKESIFSFFFLASLKQKETKQPNSIRLLRAVLTKNADLMKFELLHTLGNAEDQIASFAGENVIISDRNARCIEVLQQQLAAGKPQKIGIFYGAAHFPDMEKRLMELGFTRGDQEWLTAWDVARPVRSRSKQALPDERLLPAS